MLCIAVPAAEEGMKLALPVYHPQMPGHVLLQPGFTLERRVLRRVAEFGVRELWVQYPALDSVDKFVSLDMIRARGELASQVGSVFQSTQAEAFARIDYRTYEKTFQQMIGTMLSSPAATLYLDQLSVGEKPLMDHCLRVSYLSVLMGVKLDAYLIEQRYRMNAQQAKQVSNLGLGAMLHDVGKLSLDPEILERHEQTGDDSDPAWQAHVKIGHELLSGRIGPTAANVVLQHHQHWDGSGFPELSSAGGDPAPLAGEQIHVYARIACVANEFDRLHYHNLTERVPTVMAVRQMLQPPRVNWFDPRVLDAFIASVPPYPPGSPVELSDGRTVVPIEHHPATPCRPTVQMMDEAHGSGAPVYIDLREHDDLSIVRAEGQAVAEHNFDLGLLDHSEVADPEAPAPVGQP